MTREILERGCLAIFLAHEQKRHERREENHGRREFQLLKIYELAEAVSEGTISDLIMVLTEYDQVRPR
jgi:hypothetical protein